VAATFWPNAGREDTITANESIARTRIKTSIKEHS
jgi:hypothetical protein